MAAVAEPLASAFDPNVYEAEVVPFEAWSIASSSLYLVPVPELIAANASLQSAWVVATPP